VPAKPTPPPATPPPGASPLAAQQPLPAFRLFEDPVGAGVIEGSPLACGCCKRARGWVYTGPVYSEDDEPIICPWCIADGAAARAARCTFNDTGAIYRHPGDDRDPPAAELAEVEERTPGFDAWQGNFWFACCGRACVFLGDADAADLRTRWTSALPTIIANAEGAFDAAGELISALDDGESVGVFVFRCPHCARLGGYLDLE
jgi:uncharacterized protein CbrC (UPF0167 family)